MFAEYEGESQANDEERPLVPPTSLSPRMLRFELAAISFLLVAPSLLYGLAGWSDLTVTYTFWDEVARTSWNVGAIALVAYVVARDGHWRGFFGFTPSSAWKELLLGLALVLATQLAFVAAAGSFVVLGWSPPQSEPVPDQYEPWSAAWFLVHGTFGIAALDEEMFFRAYLWTRLVQITNRPWLAVVASSALFAVVHLYDLAGSLGVFAMGLIYGAAFMLWRKMWRLVIGHWVHNLCHLWIWT